MGLQVHEKLSWNSPAFRPGALYQGLAGRSGIYPRLPQMSQQKSRALAPDGWVSCLWRLFLQPVSPPSGALLLAGRAPNHPTSSSASVPTERFPQGDFAGLIQFVGNFRIGD
jgi:hypothetical protein